MTEENLRQTRAEMFADPDSEIYLHIGFFMVWFSAVELNLTFWLAAATGGGNLKSFDLLVRGMDARIKCERLRKAFKDYRPMGPNLSARLTYFEKTSIGVRNKIAHSTVIGPYKDGKFHFVSLARWPARAKMRKLHQADSMPKLELFAHGLWLRAFAEDLTDLRHRKTRRRLLEIDHPRSGLPTEPREDQPRPNARAKPDSRARKRRETPSR